MTVSVNYAVEIYDATTNRLLSRIRRQPISERAEPALDAAKVGVRKGADATVVQF